MLPFDISRWLVEGEDVEGVHGVLVRHHQCLISRLLAEAVGITANAIAQAGIAGRQGDPSNPRGLGRIFSDIHRGKRSDGGRPLVHAERDSVRGYGDYL